MSGEQVPGVLNPSSRRRRPTCSLSGPMPGAGMAQGCAVARNFDGWVFFFSNTQLERKTDLRSQLCFPPGFAAAQASRIKQTKPSTYEQSSFYISAH